MAVGVWWAAGAGGAAQPLHGRGGQWVGVGDAGSRLAQAPPSALVETGGGERDGDPAGKRQPHHGPRRQLDTRTARAGWLAWRLRPAALLRGWEAGTGRLGRPRRGRGRLLAWLVGGSRRLRLRRGWRLTGGRPRRSSAGRQLQGP